MIYNLANNQESDNAFQFITSESARGNTVEIKIVKPHNQRTLKQNQALHLMCQQIAAELNESGLYMMQVLKKDAEIEWTMENVKNLLWRPIMKAQTGKESTTQLGTKDIDDVFRTLHKHLNEKFGFNIEWPSISTLINRGR